MERRALPGDVVDCAVMRFGELLDAIDAGLFVVVESAPMAQRAEVQRELDAMRTIAKMARDARGLPDDVPGSANLQRERAA